MPPTLGVTRHFKAIPVEQNKVKIVRMITNGAFLRILLDERPKQKLPNSSKISVYSQLVDSQ
jgi:hypothetical protein